MELEEIDIHPSAEGMDMSLEEYRTVLLFRCCGEEFNESLITDDNNYEGEECLRCGESNPKIVRRVV